MRLVDAYVAAIVFPARTISLLAAYEFPAIRSDRSAAPLYGDRARAVAASARRRA